MIKTVDHCMQLHSGIKLYMFAPEKKTVTGIWNDNRPFPSAETLTTDLPLNPNGKYIISAVALVTPDIPHIIFPLGVVTHVL